MEQVGSESSQHSKSGKHAPVIIVKKKKGGGHGHHGGAWKVAYADFVTAMMALFIVLWIVGQSEEVKKSVSSYFEDPVEYARKVATGASKEEKPNSDKENVKKSPATDGLFDDMDKLKEEAKHIERLVNKIPEFKRFRNQISIFVTEEGLRIELVEKSDKEGMFFDIGSSRLKPEATMLLKILGREISRLPNKVSIEGHTDARPFYRSSEYSNWELSTERANAARRILDKSGLYKGQLEEVRGYADTKLRNQENPLDFSNRRVSILVKPRKLKKKAPTEINNTGESGASLEPLEKDTTKSPHGADAEHGTASPGEQPSSSPGASEHGGEPAATTGEHGSGTSPQPPEHGGAASPQPPEHGGGSSH